MTNSDSSSNSSEIEEPTPKKLKQTPTEKVKKTRKTFERTEPKASSSSKSGPNGEKGRSPGSQETGRGMSKASNGVSGNANVGSTDITNRTGGAYIPPAKLRMMQKEITDKSSEAYQRLSWDLLKKSIHGLVNKVNAANITQVVQQLFSENLIRGRGLFAKSVLEAQAFSPTFTPVYAALIAVVNSKFPQIGELILRRLVLNFRKFYRRNSKQQCITSLKLIAHLVNQSVAHEVLSLEILLLLLKDPVTDAGVELAISLVKEVGQKLTEVSPRGMNSIFERLRQILHEGGAVSERVQYMIELAHAVRKDGFKSYPSVPTNNANNASTSESSSKTGNKGVGSSGGPRRDKEEPQETLVTHSLDLVCDGDQMTHLLRLDEVEPPQTQDTLNVFRSDPKYVENEAKYEKIKRAILGGDSDDEEGGGDSGSEGDTEEGDDSEEESAIEAGGETGLESSASTQKIVDKTETDLMGLRRTVYLTIQSSLTFEECAHKLLKLDIKEDQMMELCQMVVDCCGQQRSYERFYGLLASKFCLLRKEYMQGFETIFKQQYETIHRLDSNKLRNVAKLFGHMLYCDALPWTVIECIHLNENETTSSGRIFIKYLFQELSQHMGLPRLHSRLSDPTMAVYFEGIFPRDNPKHTRFAINMFTSIGLGGLTDELRAHIASVSSTTNINGAPNVALPKREGMDDSSDDSSSEDDSSDSSSNSDSTSSEDPQDNNGKRLHELHREVISNSLHTSPHRGVKNEVIVDEWNSHSAGGTPSRQRHCKGSTTRDNILRRAAIEHHRKQSRKLSSSSEDEANNNTPQRKPHSRPGTPNINSLSRQKRLQQPTTESRKFKESKDGANDQTCRNKSPSRKQQRSSSRDRKATRKEQHDKKDGNGSESRKERSVSQERRKDRTRERKQRKSSRERRNLLEVRVKREPSDCRNSSPERPRRNQSRERRRKSKDRSNSPARTTSRKNRSGSSSSRDRRKTRDTDKENRKGDKNGLYSKEVKKVGAGLNVADTLGHEIVSQYDKLKEEKIKDSKHKKESKRSERKSSANRDSVADGRRRRKRSESN